MVNYILAFPFPPFDPSFASFYLRLHFWTMMERKIRCNEVNALPQRYAADKRPALLHICNRRLGVFYTTILDTHQGYKRTIGDGSCGKLNTRRWRLSIRIFSLCENTIFRSFPSTAPSLSKFLTVPWFFHERTYNSKYTTFLSPSKFYEKYI